MTYCRNLCKLRTKVLCTSMFIGHLNCFSKLLVCVLVPFSYPISMFFLFILKISLYMWINRLFMLCATLLFSQVVIFLLALLIFLCCVEVKNFKLLIRYIYPSLLKLRDLVFCFMLQQAFPTSRFTHIFS